MCSAEVSGGTLRGHKRREEQHELPGELRIHYISLSFTLLSYSGIPQPKTGLQWQQPFLELVLACMHSHHTNHDELLGPLQRQLTTFLSAFEKVRE